MCMGKDSGSKISSLSCSSMTQEPMKVVPSSFNANMPMAVPMPVRAPPGLELNRDNVQLPLTPPGLGRQLNLAPAAQAMRAPPGLERGAPQAPAPTLLGSRGWVPPPGVWSQAATDDAKCFKSPKEAQGSPKKPEATHSSQILEQGWSDKMELDVAAMVAQALPQASHLAFHALGHYVVVRLLELGTADQCTAIANALAGSVHALCKDRFGCRVMQKAFETAPSRVQLQLAEEIRNRVIDCVEDAYGNFVVQKLVESLPQSELTFLVEEVESQAYRLVTHEYGCRVIQRLLELGSQQQLRGIVQKTVSRLPKLVRNEYGSIVVRHVLQYGDEENQRRIIRFMRSDVGKFAQCAPSSLVLERCLEVAASARGRTSFFEDDRAALVRAVLGQDSDKNAHLRHIACDKFGNYVVQRLIATCVGEERAELKARLRAIHDKLRAASGGRHVLAAMQREYGQEELPITKTRSQ